MEKYERLPEDAVKKVKMTIITVMDKKVSSKTVKQISSQKCYAKKFKYGYDQLSLDSDYCNKHAKSDFRKLCVLAEYMSENQNKEKFLILQADTMAGTADISLDKWSDNEADIVFYERPSTTELSAESFILANTEFSRTFLRKWADMEFLPPFLTAEECVQMLFLQELGFVGFDKCQKKFHTVKNRDDYMEFLACAKKLVGPARDWHLKHNEEASIMIFPRFHGFSIDARYVRNKKKDVLAYYKFPKIKRQMHSKKKLVF